MGTHRDRVPEASVPSLIAAVEAKYKKYWCGNVRGVHFISSLKRTGLDELRRAIVDTGSKLLWYVCLV